MPSGRTTAAKNSLDPDASRRIVVTGIGAVSAFGWSADALWRGLEANRVAIGDPQQFDTTGQRTRIAAEVPAASEPVEARDARLSLADRFAVQAAREAAAQAVLAEDEPDLGVFFGSSTAGMREGEEYYADLVGTGEGRAPLRLLVSHPINGPGDAVARALGATGPVVTLSSACSSGTLAIGDALRALRAGEVDVAIAGGSDSLCQLTYAGFNSLRSVDEEPCSPFRGDRSGLSLGEGAAALVLEPLSRALARGVPPLAELIGAGASCDAHHMTAPHPEGEGAVVAIERAIRDASIDRGEVHFVSAHGTGTPLNDAAEWKALRAVFGDRAPSIPTTTAKGSLGHLLGTAGSIEAVATVQCLIAQRVHPTPGSGEIDSELSVDLVREQPRELSGDAIALSTNFAFGGANAALLFRAWNSSSGESNGRAIA